MNTCVQCSREFKHKPSRGMCGRCQYRLRTANMTPEQLEERRARQRAKYGEREREYVRKYRRMLKDEIIARLGGSCACCGEARREFLSVDHINNDGAEHKRQLAINGNISTAAPRIYRDIKRQGFPRDKYRILCFNCNCARGFFGYCPHETEANSLRISA